MSEEQGQNNPPEDGQRGRAGLTPEQQAKIEAARAAKAAGGGGATSGGGKPKPTISPERRAQLAAEREARERAQAEAEAAAPAAPADGEAESGPATPQTPEEQFIFGIVEQMQKVFGDAVRYPAADEAQNKTKEPFIIVQGERLPEVFTYLRDTPDLMYDYLSSVTAIDFKTHFDVVYQLLSVRGRSPELYVRVTVTDRDNAVLPTVYDVYKGADYQEREVYDLMGISFRGHPYLRRILTWDTFPGHPLRKDWVPPLDWRVAPE